MALAVLACLLTLCGSMGSRRAPVRSSSLVTPPPVSPSPLRTDPKHARVMIAEGRFVLPGDYLVSDEYGVGEYLGTQTVDITPTRPARTLETVLVLRFADGQITWFLRVADKQLWLYRGADAGEQQVSTLNDRKKWRRRLVSVETGTKTLALNLVRMMAIRNSLHRTPCSPLVSEYKLFEKAFTFEPTTDQLLCFADIERDMMNGTRPMDSTPHPCSVYNHSSHCAPMHTGLICGDVGFGKTEVAMRAIYRAVLSGRQVALLAPTRILALQHLRVLETRMPGVRVQLLRGGGKGDAAAVKEAVRSGDCQVVVGTHALLQPSVSFDNLGLLVIDEEQRFGVGHKEKLKAVATGCDVLTLSATPIPRTLQMSLSGLRDLSLLNSPPSGRLEVTVTVGEDRDEVIRDAVSAEVARGGQVFLVVPFVADVPPAVERLLRLLPNVRVIDAHGRHDDLEDRIDAFACRKADVLVATTVIENGIDMPNVNTIIVLQANRFGISTLYQLRGRVGRARRQAFAYFMTNGSVTAEASTRLTYLSSMTALGSGYELSRRDMEMRGSGTVFGTDQSGAKDVGMDLQAVILRRAVDALKGELIIGVSETRLQLLTSLETAFPHLGPVPPTTDLNALARWEAALAELVVREYCEETQGGRGREEAEVGVEGSLVTQKSKSKSKSKRSSKLSAADDMAREFMGASTAEALSALQTRWEGALGVSERVGALVDRWQLRIACRRLGVLEAMRKDADVLLMCTSIDEGKWNGLLKRGVVPVDLRASVLFKAIPPTTGQGGGAPPITGVIVLRGVHGSQTQVVSYCPCYRRVELMLPLQYARVMELVSPLADFVGKELDEAVRNCDPDSEAKT